MILSGAKVDGQVNLIGAKVAGTLAMDSADIGQDLYMRSDCRVSGQQAEFNHIVLNGAKVGGQVDLTGAKVAGTLAMDSAHIGRSLLMASNRKVSQQQAEFNEVVLRGARVGGQVALMGAKVAGTLAMDSIEIGWSLLMASDRRVSEQQADFNIVVLNGAKVTGMLEMDSADIGESLYMTTDRKVSEQQAEFNDVVLRGAKVGGQVALTGAKVAGTLNMDSADIGQSLVMTSNQNVSEQRTELNEVILRSAKIGGQVALTGAKVAGMLNMSSADIGQSVLMASDSKLSEQRTELNEVVLRGAKVGGLLDLSGAKVAGTLDMDSVNIGQHLFMRSNCPVSKQKAEFDGDVRLIFAAVGGSLDLRGAALSSLDLTGTGIGGELRLASPSLSPQWTDRGKLVLRNASVDAIQDTDERTVWPAILDLDGFTYRRLGGLGAAAEAGVVKRGSRWFIDWLAKDEPYTPQPYQQCAKVMREMGHPDMADDVLYAGRERERKEAWQKAQSVREYARSAGIWMVKSTVGYGYGYRYFRSLQWVLLLVLVGIVVLLLSGSDDKIAGTIVWSAKGITSHLLALAFYSFDLLLPIIQLHAPHYEILLDGVAKYYFAIQKLMGWVLASFLIAGLSGLTK